VKLKRVKHYSTDDPECCEDYVDIELLDESGTVIAAWGDGYHTKGQQKCLGFIQGVEWATGEKVELETEDVADRLT